LNWEDLKFDDGEVLGLARSRAVNATDASLQVLARADGWAAGLVLLLESSSEAASAMPRGAPSQVMFDYFAAEVFRRVEPTTQDFLMQTAFLPRLSSRMGEELTAHANAGPLLATLSRRNYFTTHHDEYFQYHPLFREFLLARAKDFFPASRLAAIRNDAARLLSECGMLEEAVGIWLELADWDAVANASLQSAATLLAQGRHAVVNRWLDALPSSVVDANPWLLYWRAAAILPFAPVQSRPCFERAFDLFRARDDRAGLLLSWAGAVQAVRFGQSDAQPLDGLIARLEELLQENAWYPSEAIEYQVAHGMYTAMFWRQPQHPEFERWKERALTLARSGPDQARRSYTVYMAAIYELLMGHRGEASFLLESLAAQRPHELSSVLQSVSFFARACCQREAWMISDCLETVHQGLLASASSGVHLWDFQLRGQGVLAAFATGDLERADALLQQMASAADLNQPGSAAWYHFLATIKMLARGDPQAALPHAEGSVRLAGGWLFLEAVAHFALAATLWQLGMTSRANEHLRRGLEMGDTMQSDYLRHFGYMLRAGFLLKSSDRDGAVSALNQGLSLGRQHDMLSAPWARLSRPEDCARLTALALEAGIETDYVRRIARMHGWAGPSPQAEGWPWAIRIRTLGAFVVLVDDEVLRFPVKTQKKPLELLKALVAYGGRDRGVPTSILSGQLWPDLEGDAGKNALDAALHRLRKLLKRGDAVLAQEGKLILDPRHTWVDVWAFEAFSTDLEHKINEPDTAHLIEASEALLKCYAGHFLADEEAGWALSARERLRSKFLRDVSMIGEALQRIGAWERITDLYRRAVELDPLIEEFHRALMRSYRAQGRLAEALDAYRRCRELLSVVLGIEPSGSTQAIYRALKS
jgi:LuxR family maltose regulon positive regulatory protein